MNCFPMNCYVSVCLGIITLFMLVTGILAIRVLLRLKKLADEIEEVVHKARRVVGLADPLFNIVNRVYGIVHLFSRKKEAGKNG